MLCPLDLALVIEVVGGPQVIAHARHDEGVRIGHRDQRQRPHAGAAPGVLRQQRRVGMGLVQVLHDGERLVEHVAVVLHQRGDHHLRVDRLVVGLVLLAGIEVDVDLLELQPFEVERDAHAERRQRAPVGVQLHHLVSSLCAQRCPWLGQ